MILVVAAVHMTSAAKDFCLTQWNLWQAEQYMENQEF